MYNFRTLLEAHQKHQAHVLRGRYLQVIIRERERQQDHYWKHAEIKKL